MITSHGQSVIFNKRHTLTCTCTWDQSQWGVGLLRGESMNLQDTRIPIMVKCHRHRGKIW